MLTKKQASTLGFDPPHLQGKKTQQIKVNTPHFLFAYPCSKVSTSHTTKCDEHWYYRHQSLQSLALQTSLDIV
jgi:hypothetical protein